MKCSKCQHTAEIEAGKFSNAPWEETPCSKCDFRDGGFTIAYDENRLPEPEVGYSGADVTFTDESELMLPISVLSDAMHALLSIPPATLRIVYLRYQGRRYREIGRVLGVSAAAVEMRHWRAMQRWPILKEVFPAKEARRARRGSRQGGGGGRG